MRLVLVGTSYQRAPVELRELLALRPRPASLGPRPPGRGRDRGGRALDVQPHRDLRRRLPSRPCSRSASTASSRACPASPTPSSRRRSTRSRTRPPPSTSSASPPASTRWCPARRRSSARCGGPIRPRARPRRPARRSTACSGRRCGSASACAPRRRSARTRPPSRPPRPSSPSASSRTLRAGGSCCSARARSRDLTAANLISRGVGEIVGRQPLSRAGGGARAPLRRPRRRPRRRRGGAGAGGRRRRLDGLSGLRPAADAGGAGDAERRGRPIFFIDIAVPRDVDPAVNELEGCYLYDIDDLERVVAESVAGRREEAVRAEAIVSRGGGRIPRVAALARRRSGHRVSAGARRVDPARGARARRGPARLALAEPAAGGRGAHEPDREQAPPPADRSDEGGGRGGGRRPLRGRGSAPLRARRR